MSTFRAITAAASAGRFCSGKLSGSVASAAMVVARQHVNIPPSGFPVVSPVSSCFYATKNRCAPFIAAADLGSPAIKPVVRRLYGGSVIFKAILPRYHGRDKMFARWDRRDSIKADLKRLEREIDRIKAKQPPSRVQEDTKTTAEERRLKWKLSVKQLKSSEA